LGSPRQQEWNINQDISDAISSTPDFKACGSDGIPNGILQNFDSL